MLAGEAISAITKRWGKKLPPCPKCDGRLKFLYSFSDGDVGARTAGFFHAKVVCARRDACNFSVAPVMGSLNLRAVPKIDTTIEARWVKTVNAVLSVLVHEVKETKPKKEKEDVNCD